MKAIGSVYAELIMKPLMVVWCQCYMMFVEGLNHAHKIHNKKNRSTYCRKWCEFHLFHLTCGMDSVLNKLVKMCCDKNLQTWFAV